MPAPVPDFNAVMSDLVKFQFEIGKIHARLTNPRQKEVLGEALAKVEQARADALVSYPKALKTIHESALESKAQAQQTATKLEALKGRLAAMQAQAAQVSAASPAIAAPKPAEAPKFNGQFGQRLSDELLARVAEAKPAAELNILDDKEIWQDWERGA